MSNKKEKIISPTKPQFAIFDWIVDLPVIRILKPLYEWKRAFWIYCFLGFLSTVSSTVLKIAFVEALNMLGSIAAALSWAITTVFAFLLFRYFYFDRTNNSFISELIKFTLGRLFALGLDVVVNLVFVDILKFSVTIVSIVMIPVTAILNYFISKIFVFKNKEEK